MVLREKLGKYGRTSCKRPHEISSIAGHLKEVVVYWRSERTNLIMLIFQSCSVLVDLLKLKIVDRCKIAFNFTFKELQKYITTLIRGKHSAH